MRIFVDMDGTLAKWNNVEFEELFEEGYYRNLEPNMKILNEVNHLIRQGEDVYILSAYLTESDYAKKEKQEWVNQYLPELPKEKQIFVPYGTNKAEYLKEHYSPITNQDYLIDDYTKNLLEWKEYGGIGIKYLNGINHTKGTWKGVTTHGTLDYKIAIEKLKSYNIDLVEFAYQGSTEANNTILEDYYCVAFKDNIGYSAISTFELEKNGNQIIDVNTIVDKIMNEICISEHQFKSFTKSSFSDYYKTHYPTIYKCDDFDVLCKELPSTILDDIEYTIYMYDETYKLPQYCETGENVERISGKYIEWYEGLITTKDFLDDIQIEANNELDNDETEIDVDM